MMPKRQRLPAETETMSKLSRLGLSVATGIMLGCSFPPSTLGILACVGLVPLLIVLAELERLRTALTYSYVAMLVFHLITLNWTGGYSHGNDVYMMVAGALTMLLHPFFYFLPLGAYHFVRKKLGEGPALVALPVLWVGYEYVHSLSEWSFPWLTIGNSQSYDLARIQFIAYTGIYGLSFWILVINVLAFQVIRSVVHRMGGMAPKRVVLTLGLLAAVYVAPSLYGHFLLSSLPDPFLTRNTIRVGMVQANVDPWDKWKASGGESINLHLRLTKDLVTSHPNERPDLVLWPETAVPLYLLMPGNRGWLERIRREVDTLQISLLTGLPQAIVYNDSTKAPPSAKRSSVTGERYDSFNAAAFIQPGIDDIPWYGKMKMVPLAERIPYADLFAFLDVMRWGVGIGGWQIGPDTTVFTDSRTGARFSAIICYESVYPGFVAAFVRKGAEFIALITIDSWWGKMSGAYQHRQFAVFRAVENHRWIARCAVGGISCYIDPYGRTYDATELFTQATLNRSIGRGSELTMYTRYGDWFGQLTLFAAGLFVVAAVGQLFLNKKRAQLWQSNSSI